MFKTFGNQIFKTIEHRHLQYNINGPHPGRNPGLRLQPLPLRCHKHAGRTPFIVFNTYKYAYIDMYIFGILKVQNIVSPSLHSKLNVKSCNLLAGQELLNS